MATAAVLCLVKGAKDDFFFFFLGKVAALQKVALLYYTTHNSVVFDSVKKPNMPCFSVYFYESFYSELSE